LAGLSAAAAVVVVVERTCREGVVVGDLVL
jgi:hypothetical protein